MPEPSHTYQDATVIRATAARTPGLETDAYEVDMTARAFKGLRFERPGNLYDDVGVTSAVQGRGRRGDTQHVPLQGTLGIRGDLVLDDGVQDPLTIFALYVRDDGIEVISEGDDEDGDAVVRLHLVDIRYFWARRGELWGTYNVRRPDGSWDPATVVAGGDGEAARPRNLLEILRLILAQLPGRPPLGRTPKTLASIVPPDLHWPGTLPKAELERLGKTYGLTFALTTRNEIEITDAQEPFPEDARSGAARTLGGAKLPEGRWKRRRRRAFRHKPQAVRVVGPRVVREVRIDSLDPVGYALDPNTDAKTGLDPTLGAPDERRLVPWEAAAVSYGLSVADLARFVLLPDQDQGALLEKLGAAGRAAEIHRWAYRLFRIPRRFRGFLPILPERATTMLDAAQAADAAAAKTGAALASDLSPDASEARRRAPPLVEAETFEEVRTPPPAAPAGPPLPVPQSTDDTGVRIATEERLAQERTGGLP